MSTKKREKVVKWLHDKGYLFEGTDPTIEERDADPLPQNMFKRLKKGGLRRSEDYGSKKKPYPSVSSGNFAGGGRSYPIPTRADAVDALRLAGLHGRSDVRSKVFKKYPGLKKKQDGGYKRNSPDRNRRFNIIPSNQITMKGVDFPVLGIDNLGNKKRMKPGKDYTFPGNYVIETPIRTRKLKKKKK